MTAMLQPQRVHRRDGDERSVLYNIDWQTYQVIGEVQKCQRVFLTYDHGSLEIIVLSGRRKQCSLLFVLLIGALAEGLNRQASCFGSFTHQREDLQCGIEPDQSFYLAHFKDVRGGREIDLTRDPPPDLVVEIELSRSLVPRIPIYEAFGIPEVWRFDGEALRVMLLKKDGYQESVRSRSFPEVPVHRLPDFLSVGEKEGLTEMSRTVRQWARGLKRKRKKRN